MNEPKHISSLQNSLVKQIVLLKEKSRERRNLGLFVLEGKRELLLAMKAKYEIRSLLYFPDIISKDDVLKLLKIAKWQPNLIEVSNSVYRKMAHRDSTEGVIALVKSKSHVLDDLKLKNDKALILVAEAP